MVIRATNIEIELAGNVVEMQAMRHALAHLKTGQQCRFVADKDADPAPYGHLLAAFEAIATNGPIRVSIATDVLEASGSPEMLRTFSSFFDFSDDLDSGYHFHHEWYPGNEYIAEDSRPMVIRLAR